MKHGKKYIDAAKLIENNKTYDPNEALELCCKTATAKFDETVELHVRLGVDSRHADQQVRGAVVLPNGTGKSVRVLCFCKPERVDEALEAVTVHVDGIDTNVHQNLDAAIGLQAHGVTHGDGHLAVAGTNQHAFVLCNRTLAIFQPSGEKIIIRAEAVSGAHRQINAVSLYKSRHHSGRKPGI